MEQAILGCSTKVFHEWLYFRIHKASIFKAFYRIGPGRAGYYAGLRLQRESLELPIDTLGIPTDTSGFSSRNLMRWTKWAMLKTILYPRYESFSGSYFQF
jgi:hypothetical protein